MDRARRERNAEDALIVQMMQTSINVEEEDENAVIYFENRRWEATYNFVTADSERSSRRTIKRMRQEGHERLMRDYFSENPTYTNEQFRRRFRMQRSLLLRIMEGVTQYDDYFIQRMNAAKTVGLSTHQKVVAAMRFLAYGTAADMWDEYVSIGETTVLETVKNFCSAIVAVFGPEYARTPTRTDTQRLMAQNADRGFPGMIGSIDCMHWEWKNCPTAWHGQYTGHKHKPTIILEAVASYDTWIWQHFFGMPGSANDLNVLHRSNVFQNMIQGRTHPVHYEINGNQYDMPYFLADGIYPSYATIVKAFKNPTTEKLRVFDTYQEAVRKDVERAFGILQSRFAFINNPAKLWNRHTLNVIISACIIMHNMIVEDEQRSAQWATDYPNLEALPVLDRDPTMRLHNCLAREAKMHNKHLHFQLRADLVEHIWAIHGEQNE